MNGTEQAEQVKVLKDEELVQSLPDGKSLHMAPWHDEMDEMGIPVVYIGIWDSHDSHHSVWIHKKLCKLFFADMPRF